MPIFAEALVSTTRSERTLFPLPVRCAGALGAGAADARARTLKMPEKRVLLHR